MGDGTAKAVASVATLAPGVGELDLAVKSGVAVSDLTNSVGQAQAQSADLGLIGTSLTAESCGGDGALGAEDLPQPLRVDNRNGAVAEQRDEVPLGPVGGFRLAASADETPTASARADGAAIDIPGVVEIAVGRALAETEVFPGEGREARATVEIGLNLAGILELDAVSWTAVHRTGAERHVEGTFSLGGGTLGGLPLPLDDLAVAQEAINDALVFTGIRVELPRVETITEPSDLIRVSPLRISIDDSEAGATVLGPVLNATREQREQLFAELAEAVCESKSLLLVGDVGIAVLAGTGFLTLEIGGVEASSGEFAVGDTIGLPEPVAPSAPSAPGAPEVAAPVPGTGGLPGSPPSGAPSSTATDVAAPAPQAAASIGP